MKRVEAAKELLARSNARSGMLEFIKYINEGYIISDFSVQVCSAIDDFYSEMKAGNRPILVLQAPPQHGKSQIVSRSAPAFLLGKDPNLSVGGLSYGKDLASDMNRDVQRIMMAEEYKALFPGSSLNSRRVVTMDVEAKRNSDTFEMVGARGRYVAAGVGGALTGKRLDVGIIDDPIKNAKEALSATIKDSIWNWYQTTFLTRLSKNSGQIIMATSWAMDDLSGRIIDKYKRARVLKFPAISEGGFALVPELHPIEKLLETKSTMSDFFWSAMYQQNPIIQGGGIFKEEWFKWHDGKSLPAFKYRMIYADTAMKTGRENDYSVFQHWGLGENGKIYLLSQIRGKWEAPQLLVNAKSFWLKCLKSHSGNLRQLKIEDKASGTGLIQQLSQSGVPVAGIQRSVDKLVRMYDGAPQIEVGNIVLPTNEDWVSDLTLEISQAPNGSNDDQIDPMLDAISDMLVMSSRFAFAC